MGYYAGGTSECGGGTGHSHPNKAELDQITSAGSGKIITDAERQALYRIAGLLEQHLGITIPELQLETPS
jgi:hypothetical protein